MFSVECTSLSSSVTPRVAAFTSDGSVTARCDSTADVVIPPAQKPATLTCRVRQTFEAIRIASSHAAA
jgi:hypothetical protein